MRKLTDAERWVLQAMEKSYPRRTRFIKPENQEALAALDRDGLAAAYTDTGYSLGHFDGLITDAGRSLLNQEKDEQ